MGVTENCLISSKMEEIGLSQVRHFKEVNDNNDFEAKKRVEPLSGSKSSNFLINLILFYVRNIFK